MAETQVKTPDGGTVTVRHPDGASDEDILGFAKQQFEKGGFPAEDSRQVNAPEDIDILKGFGETALTMGTGAFAQIAGGIGGVYEGVASFLPARS